MILFPALLQCWKEEKKMSYKTFDETDYKKISEMIDDPLRVLFKDEISEDYGHDELGGTFCMPDIVIKAATTKEISAVMKYAFEHHMRS